MKVKPVDSVEKIKINADGVVGVHKQVLLSADDGAPVFTMRRFTVAPGGCTFLHTHDFEHEVYVLQGKGIALGGDKEIAIEKDTAILVIPGELHQFKNTGDEDLVFLCLVTNANN